jgi:hypothetical protein
MGGAFEMTISLEQLISIVGLIVTYSGAIIWLIRLEGKVKTANSKFELLLSFRETQSNEMKGDIEGIKASVETINGKLNDIMIHFAECGIHPKRRRSNGK